MSKPIVFSFFSGSGLLDLGFEDSGFDIQFVNECHLPFLDAYKYSRSKLKKDSPIHGYSSKRIEEFLEKKYLNLLKSSVKNSRENGDKVGFIGGPPCPDFSVGGKNKGKNGENGVLTSIYAELICKVKPDYFIFENVKGLWRTKRHREFYDEIKVKLEKSGYLLTDRLTNCIEYGAPQDRDRILLFGIHKSSSTDKNICNNFKWSKYIKYDRSEVLNREIWPDKTVYKENSKTRRPKNISNYEELTVNYWFNKNEVDNHPNSEHFFKPRAGLAKFKVIPEGDDSKKSFKRLHRWRFSPTAAYGNNEVHLHPFESRRISAAEALAIQSLPKSFELPPDMSLTNMFKTIGNGVPYLAAKGLAMTVKDYLEEKCA